MQSQVSEISPVEVELTIEVPWENVSKHMEEHFAKLSKGAKIRGFRPGKAPRKVVRQLFGKQVKAEVTAHLVQESLMQAFDEHDLFVVSQPRVDPKPIKEGEPLTFTAKVEIRPQIDEVVVDGIEVVRPYAGVSDAEVDQRIATMRQEQAEVRVPEPMRPAAKGDLLSVDYEVSIDGELKEDIGATKRPVELGDGKILPELEAGLLGMLPEETKEIDVAFADDHPSEDIRGKTARFIITVKELKEQLLPDLDDEFAQDCGDYQTLDELRAGIRQELETLAKQRADSGLRDRLVEAVVEKNPVPVPPTMVLQQKEALLRDIMPYLQVLGDNVKKTLDELDSRAERRVRAGMLLGALARQEGFDVSPEEVEAKLAEIAEATGKHIAKVRVEYGGDELESRLLEEKLMSHLLSRVTIKDATEPEEHVHGPDCDHDHEDSAASEGSSAEATPDSDAKS